MLKECSNITFLESSDEVLSQWGVSDLHEGTQIGVTVDDGSFG